MKLVGIFRCTGYCAFLHRLVTKNRVDHDKRSIMNLNLFLKIQNIIHYEYFKARFEKQKHRKNLSPIRNTTLLLGKCVTTRNNLRI